jgi:hypothetical protein
MPGRGSYGPGGKWIHDRANHILNKNPEMAGEGQKGKSIAYALATQQAHRTGKSPKGFRTAAGVRTAKRKYDGPKSDYTRTADPKRSKSAEVELATSPDGLTMSGRQWAEHFADRIREAARMDKEAAGPPPSIPTPQFPLGLMPPKPKTVGSMSTTGKALSNNVTNAQNYTQVHTQPPAVNPTPHSGLKSAQPPPVK